MEKRSGYVLIGGGSVRMGTHKALLPYRGRTLLDAVAAAVEEAAGRPVVLVGKPPANLPYPYTPDIYPGEGPLGGILSALQNSRTDWSLVVACDMPGLTGGFLRKLVAVAEASDGDALVPLGPHGIEPLCAMYHRNSREGLYRAFERGVRKVSTALEEVRLLTLSVSEAVHFQNVNTPEEWAPYAG